LFEISQKAAQPCREVIMQLEIVTKSLGTKLNEVQIYAGSTQIGEYERSQDADIERKKREIESVADLLIWVHSKHGRFTVRWNGDLKQKSVRVADIEVCIIPRIAWETPSWQS
jgi:hypothetical protein